MSDLCKESQAALVVKAVFTAIEEAPDQATLEDMDPWKQVKARILDAVDEDDGSSARRFAVALNQLDMPEIPYLNPTDNREQILRTLMEGIDERYNARYWIHRPMLQNRPRGRLFPSAWRRDGWNHS